MRLEQLLLLVTLIASLMSSMCMNQNDKEKNYDTQMKANFYSEMLSSGDGDDSSGVGSGASSDGCDTKPCSGAASDNSLFGKGNPKQKASNIAIKAAQEAKAANDAQTAAAEAAAHQVKLELADKAIQSARAAEAALAGKQQIVEQVEQEKREAEAVVIEVSNSLQNTQTNANAASQAAVEAQNQLIHLKSLVKAATSNLGNIENVANGAQQELAEKTQLLEAAKNRVESLSRQLTNARQDFEKTKQAAYKAACAAVEAKQKAARTRRMLSAHLPVAASKTIESPDLSLRYTHLPALRKHRLRKAVVTQKA